MFKNIKFPFIYAIEALLWLPLLAGFYGAASFLAAEPVANLDLRGNSLPANWEAAIPNYGQFVEGYLISNHPATFAFIIALLVTSAFSLYKVYKAQVVQRQTAGPAGARAHAVAHGCVFAVLAIFSYLFITRVVVAVSAA